MKFLHSSLRDVSPLSWCCLFDDAVNC
jgi:hypothetical protein